MVMEYLENDLKACMDMTKTPFSVSEVGVTPVSVSRGRTEDKGQRKEDRLYTCAYMCVSIHVSSVVL